MDPICSCGAALPPGAYFCPRCGRPVQEAAPPPEGQEGARTEAQVGGPAESETRPSPAIRFGNPDALRSAYPGAAIAALLGNIPLINFLCFLWYPAAGFFSVYLYRRRTGAAPSTSGGAKLGWITGVLAVVISLVLGAVASLLPGPEGGFAEGFRRQLEQTPAQDDVKRQMLELLNNPIALALVLLVALVFWFIFTVGFTTLGGALGAKVLEEERSSQRGSRF